MGILRSTVLVLALAPAVASLGCAHSRAREGPPAATATPAAAPPAASPQPKRLKDSPPDRLSVMPPETPEVDPENKQRRFGAGEAKERREQQKAKAAATKQPAKGGEVVKPAEPLKR